MTKLRRLHYSCTFKKRRFLLGLSEFVGYINRNNMKKHKDKKKADVVAIDFKQSCAKQ